MKNINSLKKGDKVRVSGGPYYLTKDGKKIKLGERGIGVFMEAHPDGKGILITFNSDNSPRYVYTGPTHISPITGAFMTSHKISKKRYPK
jgi:hypothetical protein